jgi:hypothetical protein
MATVRSSTTQKIDTESKHDLFSTRSWTYHAWLERHNVSYNIQAAHAVKKTTIFFNSSFRGLLKSLSIPRGMDLPEKAAALLVLF